MSRSSSSVRTRVLAAFILVASVSAAQNDSCVTAIPVTVGVTAGSNATATSGPDPLGSCGGMGNDVWYSWVAPCTGIGLASFCGAGSAGYDTVLAAWSGSCGALTELVCNDDNCGLQSEITFPVTAGVQYYISVGGFFGAQGSFNLDVGCLVAGVNDACTSAIPITEGVPVGGNNIGSTTGPDPVGACGGMASDVWYVLTAACSGTYSATTCDPGTGYDTVIAIWDGAFGCGGLTPVACNDDNCAAFGFLSSTVTWSAVAGQTYYVSVGGFFGGTGVFNLTVNNGAGLTLAFTNAGPGSIGYSVTGAPPNGSQFTAISLFAGNFPNGWFFGLDIFFTDLVNQVNTGFPFFTPVGACGDFSIGPIFGAPSGLTLYGVSLGFPPASQIWTSVSAPTSGTVP